MRHRIFVGTFISFLTLATLTTALAQPPNRFRPRPGGQRAPDKLKEGDAAPDFTLKVMDGKETVTLSQFQGERPVALIFGSYT